MKILDVKELKLTGIKVVRFARFHDERGYFSETYRKSDFIKNQNLSSPDNHVFFQSNESFSKKGTVRGLHFQWNPPMGKLVRTLHGRMVDIILDIRKNSPTFGKAVMYEMQSIYSDEYSEWIWIPHGFAHGNYFLEDTVIEYFCTGEYSQGYEAGISPLSQDIDWQFCDNGLKKKLDEIIEIGMIITEKDRNAFSITEWNIDPRSEFFMMQDI